MAKIFISYRREDSQHQADRLHAALSKRIPKRNIFIDVDNIPVGVDFVQHLDQQVGQCDVLLALIGPDWLEAKDPQTGKRRLDDPGDFVRIEIVSALRRGTAVAPVLLDGTNFPPEHRLPEDLKPLARRNGVEVRRLTFDADAERLIRGLNLTRANAVAKQAPKRPAQADRQGAGVRPWVSTTLAALVAAVLGAWGWFGNPGDWRGLDTQFSGPVTTNDGQSVEITENDPAENVPREGESPAVATTGADAATVLTATDDRYEVKAGATLSISPESNDGQPWHKQLRIVEVAGSPMRSGQVVPLTGGHSLRMNLSSLQFMAGSSTGQVNFYYTVQDKDGATAQALITVRVTGDPEGTAGGPPGTTGAEREIRSALAPAEDAAPAPRKGATFRDCSDCPQMVSIPSGSFMMGSPNSEPGRSNDEGPPRRVTVPAFVAGKYEVTWADWDLCVAADGCAVLPADGYGGGDRPVTNVSWNDAEAYAKWLTKKTGQTYRLLSEAEWEYAARAGTTTPFSLGSTISTSQANYSGGATYGYGSEGERRGKPIPVGSFDANAFGLHDMHGNVWEWVKDCYARNYSAGQKSNGAAYRPGSCSNRVSRGGSWLNNPEQLRSAFRDGASPTYKHYNLGFRVAKTL